MDEKTLMQRIHERYPNLIDCLGNLETTDPKCNDCDHVWACFLVRKELESIDFAPGRYREGFGKLKGSSKYD